MELKYWTKLSPCGQMTIISSWILFGLFYILTMESLFVLLESGSITVVETIIGVPFTAMLIIIFHYIMYRIIKYTDAKIGCS